MLEKLPAGVGQVLQDVRAGLDEITAHDARFIDVTASFEVHSTDFVDEGSLPVECTADGAGRSPAQAWGRLPGRSRALALIVEDADSPTPHPLVHAIAWNLPVEQGSLSRGALHESRRRADGAAGAELVSEAGLAAARSATGPWPAPVRVPVLRAGRGAGAGFARAKGVGRGDARARAGYGLAGGDVRAEVSW